MQKSEILDIVETSKYITDLALKKLAKLDHKVKKNYTFSSDIPREIKAEADYEIENLIINNLKSTGINILSEETGLIENNKESKLKFIVDPIDGTVNFIRNIAECSVSIALYDENTPIFGVIGTYPSFKIYWGGKKIGSFSEHSKLKVSSITNPKMGVLCTGFPSRFDFNSSQMNRQIKLMQGFGKTRMLGSASQSLLQIAKGSAECYFENEIMLWDVASGIPIIEGSGGRVISENGSCPNSLNVLADNNLIKKDFYEEVE